MINSIRSEWIKLRTVRANLVVITMAVGIPIVIALLTFALSKGIVNANALVAGSSVVTMLLIGVLGVMMITGEYQHNTIRPGLAATPNRWRFMLAKVPVIVAVGFAAQLIVVLIAYKLGGTLGSNVLKGDGAFIAPSLAAVPLAGVVGLGFGGLVRSQSVGITLIMLWPMLIEGLVAAIVEQVVDGSDPQRYFPFRMAIEAITRDAESVGVALPSRTVAILGFGAFAVVMFVVGALRVDRSDA